MEAWRKEEEKQGRQVPAWRGPGQRTRPNRVYRTLEEALTRFRFMPPQAPGNLYIADYIARRSLKRAPMADGSGEGWTWRFDPFLWGKLDRSAMSEVKASGDAAPMAHIFGDKSNIMRRHAGQTQNMIPPDTPQIVIPDSEHHIMVDQPLALVAALRALLAYRRFLNMAKWAALNLAVIILVLTLWFCAGAGFFGGLIPGLIIAALGGWFLLAKPTSVEH
jgi:pimeloyl-ACP methyl ester carboxylesterase